MELKFNELFKVETFDVSDIKTNWRIIYIPKEKKMMVTKNYYQAQIINASMLKGAGIVLTRTQAPKAYPKVFHDSTIVPNTRLQLQRTIILKVSPEQYAICASHGNISAYLRSLIERDNKKA